MIIRKVCKVAILKDHNKDQSIKNQLIFLKLTDYDDEKSVKIKNEGGQF